VDKEDVPVNTKMKTAYKLIIVLLVTLCGFLFTKNVHAQAILYELDGTDEMSVYSGQGSSDLTGFQATSNGITERIDFEITWAESLGAGVAKNSIVTLGIWESTTIGANGCPPTSTPALDGAAFMLDATPPASISWETFNLIRPITLTAGNYYWFGLYDPNFTASGEIYSAGTTGGGLQNVCVRSQTGEDDPYFWHHTGLKMNYRVYADAGNLNILRPVGPLPINDFPTLSTYGSCTNGTNVDVELRPGRSTTTQIISSTNFNCVDDGLIDWEWLTPSPGTGLYTLTASSSNEFDYSFFQISEDLEYYNPWSPPTSTACLSLDDLFANYSGMSDEGFWGYLQGMTGNLFHNALDCVLAVRPFSYWGDIRNVYMEKISSTATSSVNFTLDMGNGMTMDLIETGTIFDNVLTQNIWNTLRPLLNMILYISFGFYIINLFMKRLV